MSILLILIAVIAALLLLLLLYLRSNSPNGLYNKAVSHHKKGEKYYERRDYEMAFKHYNLAEECRKKARLMEEKNA